MIMIAELKGEASNHDALSFHVMYVCMYVCISAVCTMQFYACVCISATLAQYNPMFACVCLTHFVLESAYTHLEAFHC